MLRLRVRVHGTYPPEKRPFSPVLFLPRGDADSRPCGPPRWRGKALVAEVTHISPNGLWLLLEDEELLLSYELFPWFRNATVGQISHVERPSENHLYWPELDIDLSIESIRNPSAFPLVAKSAD